MALFANRKSAVPPRNPPPPATVACVRLCRSQETFVPAAAQWWQLLHGVRGVCSFSSAALHRCMCIVIIKYNPFSSEGPPLRSGWPGITFQLECHPQSSCIPSRTRAATPSSAAEQQCLKGWAGAMVTASA